MSENVKIRSTDPYGCYIKFLPYEDLKLPQDRAFIGYFFI